MPVQTDRQTEASTVALTTHSYTWKEIRIHVSSESIKSDIDHYQTLSYQRGISSIIYLHSLSHQRIFGQRLVHFSYMYSIQVQLLIQALQVIVVHDKIFTTGFPSSHSPMVHKCIINIFILILAKLLMHGMLLLHNV